MEGSQGYLKGYKIVEYTEDEIKTFLKQRFNYYLEAYILCFFLLSSLISDINYTPTRNVHSTNLPNFSKIDGDTTALVKDQLALIPSVRTFNEIMSQAPEVFRAGNLQQKLL